MIRTLDFPLQLMESFKHWRSLHGYVMFMLLAAISKGSACDAPSSPQCFRRNEEESVYVCEWSFNSNESDVTFSLNFKTCNITLRAILGTETKFGNIKANHIEIIDEELIVGSDVDMWVEAHAGNATCTSPRRSGILMHSVKYDAPHNISVSWLGNNLSLSWPAAEDYPALAEVWFQVYEHESWEKRLINTSIEASLYKVIIVNLLKSSAYRVQIRHLATKCKAPLWSNWSPVLTVPAELERELKVTNTMRLLNGTRQVTLTWEPMPHAATLGGVMYSVTDTQSSHGCPCKKKKKKKSHNIRSNPYTLYVSYSAANITVIARNAAGNSSQAIIQIPAASAAELKICDKTLLEDKLKKRTCLELYELQDADFKPESVLILTRKQKKEVKDNMKNFTRYLYFEHRCHGGKPQTVKMCHFYHKEGVPNKEPQDFTAHAETHSASLSWKEISYEHHRGFLTHYSLCIMKVGPQNEPKECFNISASVTEYDLENLTPGAEYNITLAGVTGAGEGPVATLNITTEEKPFNVWLSIGLLFVFFIFSVVCTDILKRIKNKVFPPVPVPVITEFINRHPENEQEMWDREEEVHELTLHQLPPEQTSVSEETSFLCILRGEWEDGADEDLNKERSDSAGSDDECSSLDSADQTLRKSEKTEQVDVELAMLIYRNGLVFDVKSESS